MRGLIGMHARAGCHDAVDDLDTIGLLPRYQSDGPATALADDNHNAALAGLVLGKPPIDTIRGRDWQAEGCAVLHIEIAREPERGDPLGAVAEDGDGQKDVAHLELAT
jgi:hypothetical protein